MPTRSRAKKTASPTEGAIPAIAASAQSAPPAKRQSTAPASAASSLGTPRNVGLGEGYLSVALGGLFILLALFPRSLKQLIYLGLGGFFLYRGNTGSCRLYETLGVDTTRKSFVQQITERFLNSPR